MIFQCRIFVIYIYIYIYITKSLAPLMTKIIIYLGLESNFVGLQLSIIPHIFFYLCMHFDVSINLGLLFGLVQVLLWPKLYQLIN